MAYYNAGIWKAEVSPEAAGLFTYHYLLNELAEKNTRSILLQPDADLTIRDTWTHPGAVENVWLAAPFHTHQHKEAGEQQGNCLFTVQSPLTQQALWLTGNLPELGGWNTEKAIRMQYSGDACFTAMVNIPAGTYLEYKYLRNGVYEAGENRTAIAAVQTIIQDAFTHFQEVPPRGAGVAVPVFSLRSAGSCGTGEFADIRLLADWAAATGQRIIQLLPVNDTTVNYSWTDSYPYAVISAFALHPLYLHLPAVGNVKDYKAQQTRLNAAPLLDYEQVMQCKMQLLEKLYEQFVPGDAFRQWAAANTYWLEPYTAFCCERDGKTDGAFYHFIQYHLYLQLSEAVAYARSKGIAIKGDLPIGVNLQSADVQAQPLLFHTGLQAGAPPDGFAEKGQNWGFPTYNWPAMEAEGYGWWKERLRHMAQYFSAFRIDHLLGFFRIWQIPRHAREGILGYFEPALPFMEDEILGRGVPFTRARYCEPYITDIVLYDIFSTDAVTVKATCLEPAGDGHYRLLPAYRTQAAVMEAALPAAICRGLLDLITNVLFLEPAPGEFHPRFNLHLTSSFEALDAPVQYRLSELADHFFYHRHNRLWEQEALRRLPVLQKTTNMLVCGEDLGMVPHCVPGVMQQLGILSLEVQHMPKYAGRTPADAPYLSVVTPSTHDMPTLREWQPGNCRPVIEAHLRSPAMWSIFQLQDWLALDASLPQLAPQEERINNPAVMPWYWRYRMPASLETLLEATGLNALITRLVKENGR